MATFAKLGLTGVSTGRPLLISATTQGTAITIHTPAASPTFDEVWLWVANTTGAAISFNLLVDDGSIVDPDDYYVKGLSVPANSPEILVLAGMSMNTAANVLKAFSSATGITVHGFVNRIS